MFDTDFRNVKGCQLTWSKNIMIKELIPENTAMGEPYGETYVASKQLAVERMVDQKYEVA